MLSICQPWKPSNCPLIVVRLHVQGTEGGDLSRSSISGRMISASGENNSDLELKELLGEGAVSASFLASLSRWPPHALHDLDASQFGKVFKGVWKGSTVAVKLMSLPKTMGGDEKRERMAIMEVCACSEHLISQAFRGGLCPFFLLLDLSNPQTMNTHRLPSALPFVTPTSFR